METLELIAAERRRAADFGASLTPEEYDVQSLCGAWQVRDVLGHLLMPLVTPMSRVVLAMARRGFDFDKANLDLTARMRSRSVPELVDGLREHASHPFKPPGLSHEAPLTDAVVHSQDMSRPVGRPVQPAPEAVTRCLDFVRTPKAARTFGSLRLQDGLAFRATDLDWRSGEGAEISGTGLDLLLALSGRRSALADLEGPGTAEFAKRLG